MKYIATFKTSYQISPDDWAVTNPTLSIDETTTIGEIKNWFIKNNGGKLLEIKIIECQNIKP